MKWAYYNEHDPFAAAWLRELITAGLIADGDVDDRSIIDVRADDLRGFAQCHFFAGIGGWSYALRLAGWDDARPVWTGSCPCQPFSAAGTQAGGHDPRDLWPVWFKLIAECRPDVIFGEQVEAAIGHGWLDRVCDGLEAEDYAVGACGLPGPCVGAFDIRQRLWFVARHMGHAEDTDWGRQQPASGTGRGRGRSTGTSDLGTVADHDLRGRKKLAAARLHERRAGSIRRAAEAGDTDGARGHVPDRCRAAGDLADAESGGQRIDGRAPGHTGHADEREPTGDVADTDGRHTLDGALQRGGEYGLRTEDRCAAGTADHGERPEGGMADAEHAQRRTLGGSVEDERDGPDAGRTETHGESGTRRPLCEADADEQSKQPCDRRSSGTGMEAEGTISDEPWRNSASGDMGVTGRTRLQGFAGDGDDRDEPGWLGTDSAGSTPAAGAPRFWDDVEWIPCTDGKARPAQSGIQPLAYGLPRDMVSGGDPSESYANVSTEARVGRLRGYGNSVKPTLAAEFIAAYLEI